MISMIGATKCYRNSARRTLRCVVLTGAKCPTIYTRPARYITGLEV